MNLREKLNSNPQLTMGIVVAVLVVAVLIMVLGWFGGEEADRAYYFDPQSGEVFTAARQEPPIRAPSDPRTGEERSAYIAEVMGCGTCDEDEVFAIYLRRGDEIRSIEGGPWVSLQDEDDPRLRQIREEGREIARQRCEGRERPQPCYPR